ncbi:MAG TPA: polysaccharide deacetylase family protein [Gammaproteobacteria bacterium]|nr:polysaccharide deacetylase family protein [Gammaproteobacteria bacterium]
MRLPYLRFNLHHLSLACCLLMAAGVFFYGWPPLIPGLVVLALVLLVTDGIARPGSSLFYPTVTHGPRDGRRVALSFDDGPDPDMTPQVLDVLAEYRAHATFFVIGKALQAHPEIGRRMAAEGHAIGNHSWQHSRWQNFWFAGRLEREIARGEQAITAVTGAAAPIPYRPPVGLKSGGLGHAAWRRGLTLVAWSLHSRDTRLRDPESIARRVLARVRGGDIVLLHDGHDLPGRRRPLCAPALRLILAGLRERGLECVTIPELLQQPAAPLPRTA